MDDSDHPRDLVRVRAAVPADASAMARVIVQSWRETYRGIMRDEVLDDPELPNKREEFWHAALTDERYAANRVAVAEAAGELVGVAMSGPPLDADADELATVQLYVLYVLAAHHGSGAGARLLDAVVDRGERALLWVADPNPRAQAFYRKHGFEADGAHYVDDGVHHVRFRRDARASQTSMGFSDV
jgi:GNAT superfamily N-acetyltransferase